MYALRLPLSSGVLNDDVNVVDELQALTHRQLITAAFKYDKDIKDK
jgi:hypothetical protein